MTGRETIHMTGKRMIHTTTEPRIRRRSQPRASSRDWIMRREFEFNRPTANLIQKTLVFLCLFRLSSLRPPMKTSFLLLLSVTALVLGSLDSASAATLTQSEIKKFKGTYAGRISGIAGNVSQPNNATTFDAEIKVTGKRREALPVLIPGLNARSAHFIAWRKPTGSASRAKFVGFYVGTVTNPVTLISETVSGVRTMILVDRGSGVNFRYVMRLSDTLREGSYSAQDLTGKLAKER
jgi:hypothetical protein